MTAAFLIQSAASALAVTALVALAAWARIARPLPPLDEAHARALLAEEFPGRAVEQVWTSPDGAGAVGKSGDAALLLLRAGDGYAAREIAWAKALRARPKAGRTAFSVGDPAAPRAVLGLETWPPTGVTA